MYLGIVDDFLVDIFEVLNIDDDIFGIILDDFVKLVDYLGICEYYLFSVCFMIWMRGVFVWNKLSFFCEIEKKIFGYC